jgi:Tol biopolymer transport system component
VWSPSAEAIAFVRGERGGGDIFQVAAEGGPATLLFETDRDVKPTDWLPTGQILFDYWHGTAGMDFGVFNTTDGSHELLVSGDAYEARGVVSPDQQWLAYQSSESSRNEIYVRSFQNPGVSKQVSLTGGEQPRWSPDGLQLYFRNGCDFFAVAMSDIADGPLPSPTPIFEDRNYLRSVVDHDYDVAPDGRFVFLKPLAGQSTAVYVQNFVAQLEELIPSVN